MLSSTSIMVFRIQSRKQITVFLGRFDIKGWLYKSWRAERKDSVVIQRKQIKKGKGLELPESGSLEQEPCAVTAHTCEGGSAAWLAGTSERAMRGWFWSPERSWRWSKLPLLG